MPGSCFDEAPPQCLDPLQVRPVLSTAQVLFLHNKQVRLNSNGGANLSWAHAVTSLASLAPASRAPTPRHTCTTPCVQPAARARPSSGALAAHPQRRCSPYPTVACRPTSAVRLTDASSRRARRVARLSEARRRGRVEHARPRREKRALLRRRSVRAVSGVERSYRARRRRRLRSTGLGLGFGHGSFLRSSRGRTYAPGPRSRSQARGYSAHDVGEKTAGPGSSQCSG